MLASLWLHPGPSGHAKQRQNAILKFSLVYNHDYFLALAKDPLHDAEDLLTLALYDSAQFPIYEVRDLHHQYLRINKS